MESKACKLCQAVKPLTEFHHYTKSKTDKIYHRTACKECENEARKPDQKAYREANKEKIAEKKKEYAQNNKEKIKEYYNQPEVKERSKVKVVCSICGSEIRKDGLKRHMEIHNPKNYDKNGLRIY
jgi:ribosomal protein S27E